MSKKIWQQKSNGDYSLSVEENPDWFAEVFKWDGRWHFRVGTRVKEGVEQRIFRSKRDWKLPATAKREALVAIRLKSYWEENI